MEWLNWGWLLPALLLANISSIFFLSPGEFIFKQIFDTSLDNRKGGGVGGGRQVAWPRWAWQAGHA